MTFDAHGNFAQTSVAVAPSPGISGTSLTVLPTTGTIFPATPFNATCWPNGSVATASNAEIVRVTNITGDTLTIVRGQESSLTQNVSAGYNIAETVTAKNLTDIESQVTTDVANISTLQGQMTTANSNISTAQGNITTAQGNITALQALQAASFGPVTVASTATETLLAGTSIPANQVAAGQTYKITAYGNYSTTGTPTLIFTARYGGPTGTSLAATPAITTPSAAANFGFKAEVIVNFLSTTSAVVSLQVFLSTVAATTGTGTQYNIDPTAAVAVVTSTTKVLELDITWGTSSASNTLTGYGVTQRLA